MISVQSIKLTNKLLQCRVLCYYSSFKSSTIRCHFDKNGCGTGKKLSNLHAFKKCHSNCANKALLFPTLHNVAFHAYASNQSSNDNAVSSKQNQLWRLLQLVRPEATSVAGMLKIFFFVASMYFKYFMISIQ